MNITIEKLKKWDCCYDNDELKSIFGTKKYFTPLEVAKKTSVSVEDRIWVLLRSDILGDNLPNVLKEIIDPIVEANCLNCGIPNVEKWAENWLNSNDRSTDSAWSAWSAARSATGFAARSAARSAAWSAVDSAWSAADSAAWFAAKSVRSVEEKRQLKIIKKYLKVEL